jgi:hypothetical protein
LGAKGPPKYLHALIPHPTTKQKKAAAVRLDARLAWDSITNCPLHLHERRVAVSANLLLFQPSLLSERIHGRASSASLLPASKKRDAPPSEIDDLIKEEVDSDDAFRGDGPWSASWLFSYFFFLRFFF